MLEWFLAVRFMRQGRTQTALIVAAVAIGVAVLVFLAALIGGLQADLIDRTLGAQPHIVLEPPEEAPRRLGAGEGRLAIIDKAPQRIRSIESWQHIVTEVESLPGVVAVSPVVAGNAFATRGNAHENVRVRGIVPERFAAVVDIAERVRRGRLSLSGSDALIGTTLADALGLGLGDKLRLESAEGRATLVTVVGIFELGNPAADGRWVLVGVRGAQTLLNLVGGVTSIEIDVADIYAADRIAADLSTRRPVRAESWMASNAELLTALRSQSGSSTLIQIFVILAVAMGIGSVLVVSVVQRRREVGILRAVGVERASVLGVFLLQGAVVGLAGSVLGCLLGTALSLVFADHATTGSGAPFPIMLTSELYVRSVLIALVTGLASAFLPARRAARLDPVEAIRG